MKIIIKINTKQENNPDVFGELLLQKLNFITPLGLKKKIISCSIELIQNNLKHNAESANFIISEHEKHYLIKIKESVKNELYLKLLSKINTINSKSVDSIKEQYQTNLTKDNQNTGNGLIFCRLKSENTISIIGQNSNLSGYTDTIISIKFKKL